MRPPVSLLPGPTSPMDREFYRMDALDEKVRREWWLRRGEKVEREFVSSEMD